VCRGTEWVELHATNAVIGSQLPRAGRVDDNGAAHDGDAEIVADLQNTEGVASVDQAEPAYERGRTQLT
jgi:hypothetical protein